MLSRWRKFSTSAALLVLVAVHSVLALNIVNSYSPRNRERPKRRRTDYIILHTTEAAAKGSLNKIKANGEAHYFVDNTGKVYRIISKDRVAFHAGRSMWEGKTHIDNYAIGIEIAGYHNRNISKAQYKAVKQLVAELQKVYKIPDEHVLTHSMVAYGAPNRWHKRSHRGRKRCGMQFARYSVRKKLGLTRQPKYDPDVRAGRLVNADPYLAKVLYGTAHEQEKAVEHFAGSGSSVISASRSAWDIARDKYKSRETVYIFPDGKKYRGNEIKNWRKVPVGTRVQLPEMQSDNEQEGVRVVGRDGSTAQDVAGDEYNKSSTIYIFSSGRIKDGSEFSSADWKKLPGGTRVLVGYVKGGRITSKRTAYDICGKRWNFPSTYYMFPDGSVKAGNTIKEGAVPPKTYVFYRR